MATNSPVQVGQLWINIRADEFSGSIQNLGNFPLVGFVTDAAAVNAYDFSTGWPARD